MTITITIEEDDKIIGAIETESFESAYEELGKFERNIEKEEENNKEE